MLSSFRQDNSTEEEDSMDRKLYTVHQFQGPDRFVVRKSDSMYEQIVTDRGTTADNRNPEDVKFFGMTLDEARALSDRLEATR
jgi:hypothetical protein